MHAHSYWLLISATTALLSGCASSPQQLYTWGKYQPAIYQYYQKEKSTFEEQIVILEEIIEKARADNRPVPPGFHAHLGLLYTQCGKGVEARQHFSEEKALFPESGPYMDFLLSSKERKP